MNVISIDGRRVELVSMDPHFHDISIALYAMSGDDGAPTYGVKTFSRRDGAEDRIDFVNQAMQMLGGITDAPMDRRRLRFPCDGDHTIACRRLFLEACKADPAATVDIRPLSIHDKKLDATVVMEKLGGGDYRLTTDSPQEDAARRLAVIAGGLVKLAGMEAVGDAGDRVAFACGHDHDVLVGLILVRALNARAVLRQEEQASSRGVLAAPSAQTP
jgi:hypothetical protein